MAGIGRVQGGGGAGAAPALAIPAGKKLVLVGFMGAGKSTAARLLAVRAGTEHADSDAELEKRLGMPIATFFDREGEREFRSRERDAVLDVLDCDGAQVVALGGGAVASDAVRERLRDYVTVYLETDAQSAWRRARGANRPLARDRDAFGKLLESRRPLYESVARAVVPSDRIDDLDRALGAAVALAGDEVPPSVRMYWARASSGSHPVYVGRGALAALGFFLQQGSRCFVVADEQVDALHGARLRAALDGKVELAGGLSVAAGEQHKTLTEAERVLRTLAREGMRRDDALIALGGGVVGDLAGFCAATYQRGVSVVHVPTTLVAQVDSAYGGKTGVDLPEAKNYVGAYHQPAAVVTDPDLLQTLPAAELKAGYAEVVKTALIAGGDLWEKVSAAPPITELSEAQTPVLTDLISGCLRTKLAIVAADERDSGVRASLNLGHTFAHSLEAATGYGAYRHGEAVAIGLILVLRLSELEFDLDLAIRQQVTGLLVRNGLPVKFTGPSGAALLEHANRDKKRSKGRRNMVLLRAIGEIEIGCEVDDDRLLAVIEELRS